MAIPVNTAADRIIHIVDISMGSPYIANGEDLDEYTRKLHFKFSKEKRQRIGAVRQTVNVVVQGTCMKFYKTRFTSTDGKQTILDACTRADREMKAIDPKLHVTPIFYEVQVASLSAGNMFDSMKNQLSIQVHQRVLDRVKDTLEKQKREDGTYKPMTGKTRTALLTMLDKVKEINVLGDENVDQRIEAMRAQIQQNSLIPLRDEILAYIEDVQGAENLEITPDLPAEPIPGEAEPEPEPEVKTRKVDEIHIEDLL